MRPSTLFGLLALAAALAVLLLGGWDGAPLCAAVVLALFGVSQFLPLPSVDDETCPAPRDVGAVTQIAEAAPRRPLHTHIMSGADAPRESR